jgi:hypothetical protein
METDNAIDDVDEEPVSELQEVITAKEAKYLFNRLYSFFEQKVIWIIIYQNIFNCIEDKIEEI